MKVKENMSLDEVIASNPGLSNESSILNVARHPTKTTEKYTPTDDVSLIKLFNAQGWRVKNYVQIKARDVAERLFKPYLARFENPAFSNPENDGAFQIIQRNAKDGTKSYEFLIGFFNSTYNNSFIIGGGRGLYEPIKIRHTGNLPNQVGEALEKIVPLAPKLYARINQMKQVVLTEAEKREFAAAAIVIRCGEEKAKSMNVDEVLKVRHETDNSDSLWNVLNTVHENIVNCPDGVTMLSPKLKIRKARALKGINVNVRVSSELWNLAEEFLSRNQ